MIFFLQPFPLKKFFCRSFPLISLKKCSQQTRLAQHICPSPNPHPSSSLTMPEIQMAGHAQHSFCAWFTESLRKPQLQSHCSLWCSLAAAIFLLCPHPLPAGFFLAIMIYVALLHTNFNCGTLPYLIPVAQFLPSSVITGVLASHPDLHLTAKLLELVHTTSRSCSLQDINSHSWEHPLFLLSPSSLHISMKLTLEHYSLGQSVTNPISMCHSGCIKVIW